MSRGRSDVARSRLYLGLVLIAVGTAHGLAKLDLLDVDLFWDVSPLILVWIGMMKLRSHTDLGRVVGAGLAGIGLFLTAGNLGWISWTPWDLWPLVPIAFGLRLLLYSPPTLQAVESFHSISSFTMMAGLVRGNNSAHFRGGDVVAIMGGADFDLRQARITEGPAVIDAFAFWGGIDIKVPKDWKVTIEGIPLLGAFEETTGDEDLAPLEDRADEDSADELYLPLPEPRQELIVRGFAVMGGVGITR